MGREIEIKIPLKNEEYSFIFDLIYGKKSVDGITCGSVEKLYKKDEYYSLYDTRDERIAAGEPQVIRIRTENHIGTDGNETKAFFTLKRKKRENGIELNKEDETFIEDPEVLRDLFLISKYKCFFNKEKDALSCHCKSSVLENTDFHLELEKVNGMPYVEIEVTEENCDADVVKQALNDFVCLLKLNPGDKDPRSWEEIIKTKK